MDFGDRVGAWTPSILRLQGKLDDALTTVNKALVIATKNAYALATRALVHSRQGNIKEALTDIQEALNVAPNNTSWVAFRDEILTA